MVQLTGYATHCIQPPDRSFFSPLKSYCTQAADKWLSTNPGMKVTQFHVDDLVTEAYGRAATVENAIGGFRMTWNLAAENFNQKDAPLSRLQNSCGATVLCNRCLAATETIANVPGFTHVHFVDEILGGSSFAQSVWTNLICALKAVAVVDHMTLKAVYTALGFLNVY
ncbi:hypothetical protein J6590_095605 [Homalodisca vitripennis]|nr:hypothetical protein J6590_095605 [Homalodisca vitripennis]